MDNLNTDCLIYISKFLSFRDKISLIKTSKKMHDLRFYIFKNDLVEYKDNNTRWLRICRPKIRLTRVNKRILSTTSIFKNIHTLDLSFQKLTTIPPCIFQLTCLKYLSLHDTNIRVISPDISKLINLEHLYMYSNRIKDFRACCNLPNLKKLDLSYNKIVEIPDEIDNLISLKKLSLEFNSISSISPNIGKLCNLKSLILFANYITSLPSELKNLKLKNLYINFNELTCVCNRIPTSLKYLDVSNNENLKCCCRLNNFIHLESIDVSKTNVKLENIPIDCKVYDFSDY